MKTLKMIICLLAVFAAGLVAGRKSAESSLSGDVVVRRDTLVFRDTVTHEKPVYLTVRSTDTMLVAVRDTVLIRDTAFIALPREEKVYGDSTYRAVVSGYRPSLDTISVYPVTRHITETQTICVPSRKRWGIGVQAGYGAHVHEGRICPAPYVGIGISYNIIRW